jgi:hypothetical protein
VFLFIGASAERLGEQKILRASRGACCQIT